MLLSCNPTITYTCDDAHSSCYTPPVLLLVILAFYLIPKWYYFYIDFEDILKSFRPICLISFSFQFKEKCSCSSLPYQSRSRERQSVVGGKCDLWVPLISIRKAVFYFFILKNGMLGMNRVIHSHAKFNVCIAQQHLIC